MASNSPAPEFKNPVVRWVDTRLPVFTMMSREYGTFPTPRNFNYFWNFGAIAMVMLMLMIFTGIFLAMAYTAHVDYAFDSVERIMRDVNWGWLIRYLHMNGASFFFVAVFIHIFRGLYYGSYKAPRELLWMLGVVILLLMMATAFMGYVLPWGQMSFWGATVITNLLSAIPLVGDSIVTWLWGGFAVGNPTLNRFYALHYLLPFVILGVVVLHVAALHVTGSNNPLGIEPQDDKDTLPFHPYYTSKDMFGLTVFLMVYAAFVFFAPNFLGHPDNYIEANPLSTPAHIVPEWYFLPFYAILRAITFDISLFGVTIIEAKLGGVLLMFGSIGILFILPWLDTSKVRSAKFRPVYKWFFWLLVIDCLVLGYVGSQPPDKAWKILLGQAATAYYFFHFLILLPLLGRFERPLQLPGSIAEAVLAKNGRKAEASGAAAGATASLVALAVAGGLALALFAGPKPALAAGEAQPIPEREWSFDGLFGTFDQAAAQRGLTVYRNVCSACHALSHVAFRSLEEIGFSEAQVKAIAADYTVTDGPNDEGEMYDRAAIPADHFPSPFPNEPAARAANGGAYPPDLSLVVKAREDGPNYVAALLHGYRDFEPGMIEEYHLGENFKMGDGMYFNLYFPGYQIAMPPPLTSDGQVEYLDGTEATIDQMAHDVAVFLTWAAEPKLDQRHNLGWKVLMVLVILAGVLYAAKRKVWADVEH